MNAYCIRHCIGPSYIHYFIGLLTSTLPRSGRYIVLHMIKDAVMCYKSLQSCPTSMTHGALSCSQPLNQWISGAHFKWLAFPLVDSDLADFVLCLIFLLASMACHSTTGFTGIIQKLKDVN